VPNVKDAAALQMAPLITPTDLKPNAARDMASCGIVAICCMIGTRNILGRSGPSLRQARLKRLRCLRAART
jgi:hypothetical protein